MAIYLILSTKKPKIKCHTTKVNSSNSHDLNSHRLPPNSGSSAGYSRFSGRQISSLKTGVRAGSQSAHQSISQPKLEDSHPQPSPWCGPGDSPSTHSTSSDSSRTLEGTNESRLGVLKGSQTLEKALPLPSQKQHWKCNRVEPIYIMNSEGRATTKISREVKPGSLLFQC